MINEFLFRTVAVTFAMSVLVPGSAGARNHKKQDADYVRQWCEANGGEREKVVSAQSRVDCLTSDYAVEVDYIDKWQENVNQALRYGKESGKKAKLVLVIEDPTDIPVYEEAKAAIETSKAPLSVERLDNFSSFEESHEEIPGPPVKKSKNSICHVKGVGSYGRTEKYSSFNDLQSCIKSGGRPPKGMDLSDYLPESVESRTRGESPSLIANNERESIEDLISRIADLENRIRVLESEKSQTTINLKLDKMEQ